ncbi:MAG: 4Fe-4S cluster-binding domain-containing protein [Flavobacteriales bacterium]|nr:4Fe-4S cluster-binding domain-containing protein [Flavobacteriales bacterium]
MTEEQNKSWLMTFGNKSLRLILFITEQCNFRCVYCYEDFKLGKIEDCVVEGIKNLIINRASELSSLHLSFFGGEPLLNKKAVIEISSWAKEFCEDKEITYIGDITTNGYSLDKNIFESLLDSGVTAFQITIDGEKNTHDKLRPTVNGKSTFDKIYSNLLVMANSQKNFWCTFRFNIADSNFESVKSFIIENSIPFTNDDRFTFHFHPIFGMPKLVLTKEEQIIELKTLATSKRLKFDNHDENGMCYAAKANSFVIRANGVVQKCTVALNSDINNIGKINKDGTMDINQRKLKKWIFAEDKMCPIESLKLENLVTPYADAGKFVNIPNE